MWQARPTEPQPRDTVYSKHAQESIFSTNQVSSEEPERQEAPWSARSSPQENQPHFCVGGGGGGGAGRDGPSVKAVDEQAVGGTGALLALDP